jgi:anti-sigma B factor antagonist
MALELTDDGGGTIRVSGEIDLASSPDLREAVLRSVEKHDAVQVDLRDAKYMDSSGVATLVEGLKASREKGCDFSLVSPSEPVMKVLKLSRLDSLFDIQS